MATVLPPQNIPVPVTAFPIVKDAHDPRDFMYSNNVVAAPLDVLPPRVDLTPKLGPAIDQGELGSCTSCALAGAIQYLHGVKFNDLSPLSRLFIYYNERLVEGDVPDDNGAQLRDGIKTLADWGVCKEDLWPYIPSKFTLRPSDDCYSAALANKIITYSRVTNLDELKHSLASGFPVVLGIMVYQGLMSAEVARTGVAQMPVAGEQQIGGHAVLCVGYSDDMQRVTIRNSWSQNWGMAGNFTLPYAYITNPNLAMDMWSISA